MLERDKPEQIPVFFKQGDTVTHEELREAMLGAIKEINKIRKLMEESADPQECSMLSRRLRELQLLQLWHLYRMQQ